MKHLISILILAVVSPLLGQVYSPGTGMVYEDDPIHEGYVNGKIYFNNGEIKEGLVFFAHTHTDQLRLKQNRNSDFEKFVIDEISGFTLKSDSFTVIQNFSPEVKGTIGKTFFKKGFAKVLIDGPITLFKHYSLQSVRNMQIVRVESFILARKEEAFTRMTTIPTSTNEFIINISNFFKRNKELSSRIVEKRPSFLVLRNIVEEYNESYSLSEASVEESSITIFRQKKKEHNQTLHLTINDSINVDLDTFDLSTVETEARINKICIDDGNCLLFRADDDVAHFIECSFTTKHDEPRVQYTHPLYADPIVNSINRKRN